MASSVPSSFRGHDVFHATQLLFPQEAEVDRKNRSMANLPINVCSAQKVLDSAFPPFTFHSIRHGSPDTPKAGPPEMSDLSAFSR